MSHIDNVKGDFWAKFYFPKYDWNILQVNFKIFHARILFRENITASVSRFSRVKIDKSIQRPIILMIIQQTQIKK